MCKGIPFSLYRFNSHLLKVWNLGLLIGGILGNLGYAPSFMNLSRASLLGQNAHSFFERLPGKSLAPIPNKIN